MTLASWANNRRWACGYGWAGQQGDANANCRSARASLAFPTRPDVVESRHRSASRPPSVVRRRRRRRRRPSVQPRPKSKLATSRLTDWRMHGVERVRKKRCSLGLAREAASASHWEHDPRRQSQTGPQPAEGGHDFMHSGPPTRKHGGRCAGRRLSHGPAAASGDN